MPSGINSANKGGNLAKQASEGPQQLALLLDNNNEEDGDKKNTFPFHSAFNEFGFHSTIATLCEEIRELYLADKVPWIIGYSGGKDSTATLQLIWTAISDLAPKQHHKPIYVISTDTLVENPIVSNWVTNSLEVMTKAATNLRVPFQPRHLTPKYSDSFWVNLIGRGYPAPRPKFRWCTYRLKIQPSNAFINSVVSDFGEAILVLGTRKAESTRRSANMEKHEKGRVRKRLSPNSSLPGSLVYTPIEDWTNDDVWFFLMKIRNPWGYDNHDLLGMYAGATADGECPLVVDTSTPSCGDSRFGCWVCTLIEADRSMAAMIQNDAEKEWMMPLLELRGAIDFRKDSNGHHAENSDRHLRDFRRMAGNVQIMANGKEIPGPYLQSTREYFLERLLVTQKIVRQNAPPELKRINLISLEELQEIRRIWVIDKHEIEDSLPKIYKKATGDDYPGNSLDDNLVLGETEMAVLARMCGNDHLHYALIRELISIERQQKTQTRRFGLFERIERAFRRYYYDNRNDAILRAQRIASEHKRREEKRKEIFSNNRLATTINKTESDV
jgi:DNA sulfur modification protein DndC